MTNKPLTALGAEARTINEANGWLRPQTETVEGQVALVALIITEASEAIEEIRHGRTPTESYLSYKPVPASLAAEFDSGVEATEFWEEGQVGKPEGVPAELADVIIRTVDIANLWGIDLDAAVAEKLAYNKTRSYRHEGKTL